MPKESHPLIHNYPNYRRASVLPSDKGKASACGRPSATRKPSTPTLASVASRLPPFPRAAPLAAEDYYRRPPLRTEEKRRRRGPGPATVLAGSRPVKGTGQRWPRTHVVSVDATPNGRGQVELSVPAVIAQDVWDVAAELAEHAEPGEHPTAHTRHLHAVRLAGSVSPGFLPALRPASAARARARAHTHTCVRTHPAVSPSSPLLFPPSRHAGLHGGEGAVAGRELSPALASADALCSHVSSVLFSCLPSFLLPRAAPVYRPPGREQPLCYPGCLVYFIRLLNYITRRMTSLRRLHGGQ